MKEKQLSSSHVDARILSHIVAQSHPTDREYHVPFDLEGTVPGVGFLYQQQRPFA